MKIALTRADSAPRPLDLIEYGDPTHPHSRLARQVLDAVADEVNGDVCLRYRHFPNLESAQSVLAACALEAAASQHQFWPMYYALGRSMSINLATLARQARQLDLLESQFLQELLSEQTRRTVLTDWHAGYELGVVAAPTLVIGGQRFHGKVTLARLVPFIRMQLSRKGHRLIC
ncbi:DsbA family protein [Spirosoma endbachense]|uniref:Thioredoxin domain-containing protein n=1 Tax=Spirosoma endbachense TaxID=2666025 RepID=A0A6P1W563_9BACT|nr:thioredoxin domain-containing protein [Spirosoma endbachense]QHW00166.1 thioredoxin domain-containing protein [Spirosoma endbachense]